MGDTSKDLLQLERNSSSSSSIESKLFVYKSESLSQSKKPEEKPVMAPLPPSQYISFHALPLLRHSAVEGKAITGNQHKIFDCLFLGKLEREKKRLQLLLLCSRKNLRHKKQRKKEMGDTSKDLLQLERNSSSSSSIESKLLVCTSESLSQSKKPDEKPVMAPLPPSQFLGKVRDFLGVMAEANKRLELDAKDKSSKDYDIEVLSGNESQYIEMDLMLGVADLHTPEAVAAAESVIAGNQQVIPLAASDSESESEDSSKEEDVDVDEDEDDDDDDGNSHHSNDKTCSPGKSEISKSRQDKSSRILGGHPLKKRPKIVEIL